MNFKEVLKKEAEYVNSVLEEKLKELDNSSVLTDGIRYAVLSSGKRIRPVLLKRTYLMLRKKDELPVDIINSCMTALELVHCYSLVHDDLPAMDNSDFRRGILTVHKKFGEDMGILTGDALLNTAIEFILNIQAKYFHLPFINKAGMILFQKAGSTGMIKGQVLDLDKNKTRNEESLFLLTELKTCALIEASMLMGAYLAEVEPEITDKIELLARAIGMVFQIQDDILDYEEDKKDNKLSFATYYGVKEAELHRDKYRNEANCILHSLGNDNMFFADLINYLCDRKI